MALLFWDASGLAKRYTAETGRETVNAVFAHAATHDLATTPWGYAETYSILLRKFNGGAINAAAWAKAVSALQAEVVNAPAFGLLPISDEAVFACVLMMRKHNLNATDAAILTMLLEHAQAVEVSPILLIAADQRLLRAAAAEGLATLNPEIVSPADVPALLAAL
jgi:predicted nucleic acid-binding protein